MYTRSKFLLLGIIITAYLLNAQTDTKGIANSFYNFWVLSEYYNGIIQGKTPFELSPSKISPIQIFFPRDSNMVLLGPLQEMMERQYRIIDSTKIEFLRSDSDKGQIILLSNNELILIYNKDTLSYTALPSIYNSKFGLTLFINDEFITGTYIPEDSSYKSIEFAQNGNLKGIDNFDYFSISLWGIGTPKFDTIIFRNSDTGYNRRYHWERNGDTLVLHELDCPNQGSLSPDELSQCKIGKLFHKLRIKK
jgi:hypothetical protein